MISWVTVRVSTVVWSGLVGLLSRVIFVVSVSK